MAWPTRSRVLAIAKQTPTVANTKYLVGGPATGNTWLIKAMRFYNGDAAARTFYLYLRRGGIDYPLSFQSGVPTGAVIVDPTTAVAEAGDALYMSSTVACANMILTLHGALLG